MALAGSPIEAVLTLDATSFHSELGEVSTAVKGFVTQINTATNNTSNFKTAVESLPKIFHQSAEALQHLNKITNMNQFSKFSTTINQLGNGLKALSTAIMTLGSDTATATVGIARVMRLIESMAGLFGETTVKVEGLASAMRSLNMEENNGIRATTQYKLGATNVQQAVTSMSTSLKEGRRNLALYHQNLRDMALGVDAFNKIKTGVQSTVTSINQLKNAMNSSYMSFEKVNSEAIKSREALTLYRSELMNLALGVEKFNAIETGNTARLRENQSALNQVALADERVARLKQQLAGASNQVSASEGKEAMAHDKTTQAMNRQANASKTLGKTLSSLKMMGTMVGSMIAYNFVHNLAMATTETINAKSEMNGYFQMLGYTTRQTEDFNRALDNTVAKFPRLNKYALGETISSIGVEFELTTKEMKKAMPIVSMITSEYLRAGRNVNEASLAVKDILQGEFQRLSRETGVKQEDLMEAGWSGDKTDVMGLLDALDKVGKARNWDTFVQKANSLNDAVLIVQNRFSEWSADMVEKVQPAIVGAFNTIMSVASNFASVLNGVIGWLSGDGLGQAIVKWGGLATALITVTGALIKYRTGANLTQFAQMGLTKSIGASILGLEAETVAQYGLRNAIVSSVTGIEAETLANEKNTITRQARLQAITSTITGYKLETVASKGVLKSLIASSFGAKESTLTQYGLSTAIAQATTQMEAQKLASMSLAQRIALIGATTLPAIAVVGAFAVALGGLILKTMEATEKMKGFYDIQQNGKKYVDEAKDSVKNLKSHIKELKDTQKDYTKGSAEYKNVGTAIDQLNSKLEIANQNVKDNYKALQIVNSAQKNYDTTKQELQLDLQQKINKALVDTGLSTEEANELSNNYLNDAIDGSRQLYQALQSVSLQYSKEAGGVAKLTEYWSDKGLSAEEIKVKIDPYIDTQNAIAQDIEKMKLSSDIVEIASTWGKLQLDQIQLTLKENLPKIEAGDWQGGLEGMLKGLAHGLADLPIFSDFWGWIFKQTKIKENYGGKGWAGLEQWINDSIYQIGNFAFQTVSKMFGFSDGSTTLSQFSSQLMDMINDFFNDPLGALGIDLSGFNIVDSIMKAFSGDGSSDKTTGGGYLKMIDTSWLLNMLPSADEIMSTLNDWVSSIDIWGTISSLFSFGGDTTETGDISWLSNWVNMNIVTPITNFVTDPIGTLSTWGITIPQLDLGSLIQGLFNIGGEGGFDLGGWLGSIFNIDGIVASFTTNLWNIFTTASSIASSVGTVFANLKSMIWGHIQGILTNVTTTFTNIKNMAVTQINGLSSGIKGGIDKVVGAFNYMKDSILNSAKMIYDGVKKKFDDVKNTIGDFWNNLTNPSNWGKGAGSETYQRRSPRPLTARKMVNSSPVIRKATHHGAGINPYKDDSQTVKLKDLMGMIGGDNKVRLSDFLSMFTEGGFGDWDFHEPVKKRVFDTAKNYKTGSPNIQGIGTVGDGYLVSKFWDGKPNFSFDEFMAVAQAIFSAIPYKFYYDSEWKGNWLNALLSGALNCSDGADALIALASVFGFSGSKVHTTTKSGIGHFYAVIGGKPMDTTNFQQSGSWSPLGGAGIPTRTSYSARSNYSGDNGKTVNITVDMSGATVYGVEDLDSRIQESVQKGIQSEFNDPYTVAI